MTTAQWLFHYLEICHYQKRDFKFEIEKLRAGSSDIKRALKYLMIVTEPDRGRKAVEAIEEEDENRRNNPDGEVNTGREEKALNNEDQELWDWMQTTPETRGLPKQVTDQIHDRKFVVEAKSLADVAEDLGLIGMNEETHNSNDIVDTSDNIMSTSNESTEIHNEEPVREPVRIQSIGNIKDEEISLGFEIE